MESLRTFRPAQPPRRLTNGDVILVGGTVATLVIAIATAAESVMLGASFLESAASTAVRVAPWAFAAAVLVAVMATLPRLNARTARRATFPALGLLTSVVAAAVCRIREVSPAHLPVWTLLAGAATALAWYVLVRAHEVTPRSSPGARGSRT